MRIYFLGTNGWFDTAATGNTICTLVVTDRAYLVFDAGFGLHKLDQYIKDERPVYLFISHFHLDHVCGFHVIPKFKFKQPLTIFYQNNTHNHRAFKSITSHPLCMNRQEYGVITKVQTIVPGGYHSPVKFECLPLQHVDPCLGYRVYAENKIITYCCDTAPCENDVRLAQGADVLIHECAMSINKTDVKWGHTNPVEAARLAKQAGVKKLVLTHFGAEGYASAAKRTQAVGAAKKIFPTTLAARDGLVVKV